MSWHLSVVNWRVADRSFEPISHRAAVASGTRSRCRARALRRWVAAIVVCFVVSAVGHAYVPASDDEIVAELPFKLTGAFKSLRKGMAKGARLADSDRLALIRHCLELALETGESRFVARAWRLIQPLLEAPGDLGDETLFLHSALLQKRHDFNAAIERLETLLQRQPALSEAWLSLIAVYRAKGRYEEALSACDRLRPLLRVAIYAACRADFLSLTGRGDEALRLVAKVTPSLRRLSPAAGQWVAVTVAQVFCRLGLDRDCARWFHVANRWASGLDAYSLGEYADLLLYTGRYQDVLDLLPDDVRNLDLKVRRAFAASRLGLPDADESAEQISVAIADAVARDDWRPSAFEARYSLWFGAKPERALDVAYALFDEEKEPANAQLLLDVATANYNSDLVDRARAWFAATGVNERSPLW